MRRFLKQSVVRAGFLLPLGKDPSRVYTTITSRSNLSGPNRFLANLEAEMERDGGSLERWLPSRCASALVITRAPDRGFFDRCARRGIRTVARVDGFYVPELFDGRDDASRKKRDMTWAYLDHNQGMQDALKAADWVIYQSRFSKMMADRYLYARWDGFSIIPNGVNLERFHASVPRLVPEVVALGSWRDEDLVLVILHAFRRISERMPEARFRLIGTTSPEVEAAIAGFLKEHPIANGVACTGTVTFEDLPKQLSSASVALQLKSGDWCPNSVLELMASGVPVICQEWGGTKELLGAEGGITLDHPSYTYDTDLAGKATEAALKILEEPERWQANARNRAERYSMQSVYEAYRAALHAEQVPDPWGESP